MTLAQAISPHYNTIQDLHVRRLFKNTTARSAQLNHDIPNFIICFIDIMIHSLDFTRYKIHHLIGFTKRYSILVFSTIRKVSSLRSSSGSLAIILKAFLKIND